MSTIAHPTEPDFPAYPPTSGEMIAHAADRYGDRTLAVLGDERLSFAEADARSALMARGLLARGVGKGSRVGLLAPNGPAWIVGWLAATRIGAVVALLNTYAKARELAWTTRHADVAVLLTVDRHLDHDYLDRLESATPGLADAAAGEIVVAALPYLRSVLVWGEGERGWTEPVSVLDSDAERIPTGVLVEVEAEVTASDPMVVVYSSGSTADPKGALHSHGTVVRHAHNLWRFRDLREGDVLYSPMPLFWVGGLSYTLVAAIHAGATLVFEERFEPAATLDLLERERVTHVIGWPHMSAALTEHPSFADRDLSSIRGGTLTGLVPADRRAKPGEVRATSLGMTETCGPHTIDDHRNVIPASKAGSFGLSVPGLEHRVVDPATGEDVATGELGELWVRGYSLMLGLHKHERGQVFTPDGWYRTGDAGFFDDDGHFYFKGRLGHQIKSAGMNITPREVELVLESFAEVSMAFVAGVPHPDRGEDVVAAVVLTPGAKVTGDELRARVKDEIASYKVPRHIELFTDRNELAWLDSGKADIRAIQAELADRYRGAHEP